MDKSMIDKVFVTHWNKLSERKKFMEEQFVKNGIKDVSWVIEYLAEDIESEKIKQSYPLIFETRKHDKNIRPPVISLLLKHCHIVDEIVKNEYGTSLIFEDDAILVNEFSSKLEQYMKQLPSDWDLFWVGTCCNIHSKNLINGLNVYEEKGSRCCHAYMVSLSGAKKIQHDMKNIDTAIDWYYNTLIERYSLKNFWAEPALSFQNKSFKTTLQLQ